MGRKSTAVFCIWWAGKQLGTKINVLKMKEYQKMSIVKVVLNLISTFQENLQSHRYICK